MTALPREKALPWKSALLVAAVAAVLCFVPLFDLLGYESAAAMGAVLGLLVLLRTAWVLPRDLLSDVLGPLDRFLFLLPRHLALLLPAMLLLSLNALRVKNCDLSAGIAFFAVIPAVSVVAGQALGFLVAVLANRWLRLVAGLGLVVLSTGAFVWRLAWYPSIQGHSWTIGWFAGSIYDEALALPTSLLWARFGVLLGSMVIVGAMELAWRRRHGRPVGRLAVVLALGLVGLGVLHAERADLGIEVDTDAVRDALGGRLETEHFVIWYGAGSLSAESRRLLAEDHEFRYAELADWFDEDPVAWRGRKLESFVYPDRGTQYRLMGSRNTLVARPWTHQMNIRWDGYGDHIVAHELAHLFTAPFGHGPLQMSTRLGGLVVDQGLVEGIARAADDPADELTAHQASRAMRELGIAPDLRRLSDPAGFWTAPGRRAYTLVGSFVQWLVETQGIAPFKQAYGQGDFQAAYGVPVTTLIEEWEAWVDQVPLSDAERELAAWRFRRGSIFQRVCARTMAELERRADVAEVRGEYGEALELREHMQQLEPGNPDHALDLAHLRRRMGEEEAALGAVEALLADAELGPRWRLQVEELQGDLLWEADRAAEAAESYAGCLVDGLDESTTRRLQVKERGAAAALALLRQRARHYLVDEETTRSERLWSVLQWSALAPDDAVARYLVGRNLVMVGQYQDALAFLGGPAGSLPSPALDEERRLVLAQAAMHAGLLDLAEASYRDLLADTNSSRVRALAREGAARVQWKRTDTLP